MFENLVFKNWVFENWASWLLFLAFTLSVTFAGLFMFLSAIRRYRFIQDTPTSKIRSAAQGYIELYGFTVKRQDVQIESPLTRTPCVWWDYTIEEYRTTGKTSNWWVIERKESLNMLKLNDSSGECLIDPKGAKILPLTRKRWEGNQRYPYHPKPTKKIFGLFSFGKRYRYTERRIHQDEPLYAIGYFYSQGGAHQVISPQAVQAKIVRDWKKDFPNLLQHFDHDRSGHLDEQEWQQVRTAALQQAERQQRNNSVEPARNFMRKPDDPVHPYILSSFGESDLVRKFRIRAILGVLLCAPGVAGLWFMVSNMPPF